MIEAVIFDMDGVIFDTERVYMNIWKEVYSKYGYTITEEFYKTLIGRDRGSVIKILLENFGNDLKVDKIFEECDSKLKEAIDSGKVDIKEGVLEIFDYLKENNYKMALATSSHKAKLDMQLKIHNLEEVFDTIVCGDDVVTSKPDPTIFLVAADRLKVKPESCIVIEDSPAGVQAAFNAKMTSFHVEDLVETNEDIKMFSNKQFKSLLEVKSYLIETEQR